MKNEQEKSDPSLVAKRPANKPEIAEVDLWGSGAELAEQREGTEGNTGEQHTCRTLSRESVSQGLERVREAAKQRKKERFTALLHHVTIDLLKDAYSWLKREAAPGVDGRTWQSYKQNLEVNLAELHSRIHRAPIERSLHDGATYQNPMGGNARWGSPHWKIRSFNVQWWRCSTQSTKKTSSGSRTGSDPGVASTMRWTPWLSGSPARRWTPILQGSSMRSVTSGGCVSLNTASVIVV